MKKIFISLFFACSVLASFAQDQLPKGSATGTNTYAVTIAGGPAVLSDGLQIVVKLANANTNTSTLNVNSLGAKAVKLNGVALVSGDLPANVYMLFTYNASTSSWQVSKPGSGGGSPPAGAWSLTGNTLGADTKWLGSSDNFNVGFKTNNTVRETILKGGQHIWGSGTTLSGSETYSFQGGDVYVDDNFLVNNAITTSTRSLFGGNWVYGANYGASYSARSLVDKNYVDSSFTANPVEITVGTTPINSGTSGAIPFNGAGVYQEDATKLFWDNTNNRLGIGTNNPGTYATWIETSGNNALAIVNNVNSGYCRMSLNNDDFSKEFTVDVYGSTHANAGQVLMKQNDADVHWDLEASGAFGFYTSTTLLSGINVNGEWGTGVAPVSGTRSTIKGSGATSATFAEVLLNSASTELWKVRNDGYLQAGLTSTGGMTIGNSSGYSTTATTYNTLLGFTVAPGLVAGSLKNTGVGAFAFGNAFNTGADDNTALGYGALYWTEANANTGLGAYAGLGITTGTNNTAVGWEAMGTLGSSGDNNVAIGYQSQRSPVSSDYNTSVGMSAAFSHNSGEGNTNMGAFAGYTNVTGAKNVKIGYGAGYYELGSNKLFIDNATRSDEADGRIKALIYGVFDASVANQSITFNAKALINGRLEVQQGADVASLAGAIAVGTDGNVFELTGTNSVTLLSSTGWQNASEVTFLFTSTATIVDGTANSGADIGFECAGNANFVGSADDVITFILSEIGGVIRWREKSRSVN